MSKILKYDNINTLDIPAEYLDITTEYIHQEKSSCDSNKVSLNQTNSYIVIRSKKSFFYLKKFLDWFFPLNLRNKCRIVHA